MPSKVLADGVIIAQKEYNNTYTNRQHANSIERCNLKKTYWQELF